jgi:SAM-dependent methyltransferase
MKDHNSFTLVDKATADFIGKLWDKIAWYRYEQIRSKTDVTYNHVLMPKVLNRLRRTMSQGRLLDVGCGVGFLSSALDKLGYQVTGIDCSKASVSIASRAFKNDAEFIHTSVEDYATTHDRSFRIVVGNMFLMDAVNLRSVMPAMAKLLSQHGKMVLTFCHPSFWPRYWSYEDKRWFDYSKELIIEAPFRISHDTTQKFRTIHIHRPLEVYFDAFNRNNLDITHLEELHPEAEFPDLYPSYFPYPRFLYLELRKRAVTTGDQDSSGC